MWRTVARPNYVRTPHPSSPPPNEAPDTYGRFPNPPFGATPPQACAGSCSVKVNMPSEPKIKSHPTGDKAYSEVIMTKGKMQILESKTDEIQSRY